MIVFKPETQNAHAKIAVAAALQRFMAQTLACDHGTISLLGAVGQNTRFLVYQNNQIAEFRKLLENLNRIAPEHKEDIRKAIQSLELSELVITIQPICAVLLQMDGLICKKQISEPETASGEKKVTNVSANTIMDFLEKEYGESLKSIIASFICDILIPMCGVFSSAGLDENTKNDYFLFTVNCFFNALIVHATDTRKYEFDSKGNNRKYFEHCLDVAIRAVKRYEHLEDISEQERKLEAQAMTIMVSLELGHDVLEDYVDNAKGSGSRRKKPNALLAISEMTLAKFYKRYCFSDNGNGNAISETIAELAQYTLLLMTLRSQPKSSQSRLIYAWDNTYFRDRTSSSEFGESSATISEYHQILFGKIADKKAQIAESSGLKFEHVSLERLMSLRYDSLLGKIDDVVVNIKPLLIDLFMYRLLLAVLNPKPKQKSKSKNFKKRIISRARTALTRHISQNSRLNSTVLLKLFFNDIKGSILIDNILRDLNSSTKKMQVLEPTTANLLKETISKLQEQLSDLWSKYEPYMDIGIRLNEDVFAELFEIAVLYSIALQKPYDVCISLGLRNPGINVVQFSRTVAASDLLMVRNLDIRAYDLVIWKGESKTSNSGMATISDIEIDVPNWIVSSYRDSSSIDNLLNELRGCISTVFGSQSVTVSERQSLNPVGTRRSRIFNVTMEQKPQDTVDPEGIPENKISLLKKVLVDKIFYKIGVQIDSI